MDWDTKKNQQNCLICWFLSCPDIPDQNVEVSNWTIDGNKTANLGKFVSGESIHPKPGNIVLSGVPSKFKIRLFL